MRSIVPLLMFALIALPGSGLAQEVEIGRTPAGDTIALSPDGIARALDTLPDVVRRIMERSGVPGVAVAVVHGGEAVFAEGFGVRDMRTGEAVTTNTVFQIASISKPISATVTAVAVTGGGVSWDDPISTHLPALRFSEDYVTRNATIGDFFAHRSGLPATVGDELEDLGFARDEILARLAQVPLDPFRITYHYANFGTTIAAEAVAAATGTAWEDLAEDSLFAPLGMNSTSYRHADLVKASERATLHALEDGAFQPLHERNADAQAPAGGVSSSVSDMAIWVKLLLAGGTVDGRTLFEPEALLPALQPQITSGPGATVLDRSGAYGYGFNVGVTAGGRTSMSHSGAFLLGAATHFQILPGADIGIVVLSNGAPVGAVEAIGAHFMDVVQFGEPTRDWFAAYHGAMSGLFEPEGDLAGQKPPRDAEPARALASYAGRYDSAYYGAAEIAEEDGALVLTLGPDAMRFELGHWTADTFALTPRGENAPVGSLSSVEFSFEGGEAAGFRIDHLDRTGLGNWGRSGR
jgi:CubicO group peptidase (beta-lactamase class C family)